MAKVADLKKMAELAGVQSCEDLPHEFLARIMRGEKFVENVIDAFGNVEQKTFYPSMSMRMDAARIAAPYLAPKVANTTSDGEGGGSLAGLASRLDKARKRLA